MIVENQFFNVKITKGNIAHYIKKYPNIKLKDIITVNALDLTKGSQVKVNVQCDYCGKIVKVVFADYCKYKYDKYSCCSCRQRKTSEYNLKDRQKVLYDKVLAYCNKMEYSLITKKSDITSADTRVQYVCPKHGLHETKIYTLITEHECRECAVEKQHILQRKTPKEVYEAIRRYGGILLNKEDYEEWNSKNLKVICGECGEIFTTSYGAFISRGGQVCPKCSSAISKGERFIKNFLELYNIKLDMQYRFNDCRNKIPLPFDFYISDNNMCIEYDGEGHYQPIHRGGISDEDAQLLLDDIKTRDNIKTNYCKDNGIQLLRIPYWEFNNIENILKDNLLFT